MQASTNNGPAERAQAGFSRALGASMLVHATLLALGAALTWDGASRIFGGGATLAAVRVPASVDDPASVFEPLPDRREPLGVDAPAEERPLDVDEHGVELRPRDVLEQLVEVTPEPLFSLPRFERGRVPGAFDLQLTKSTHEAPEDPEDPEGPEQPAHAEASVPSTPAPASENDAQRPDPGAGAAEPVLLEAPAPAYPFLARRMQWEGTVVCRLRIGEHGDVLVATVETSSGHQVLDEAALAAVRRWRFRPGLVGGRAAPVQVLHRITFRL